MASRNAYSSESAGPTIQRLLTERGMSYRELAGRAGLSAGYLNHLAHEHRPSPSNEVLARIARAFDVTPEHFREYRIRTIAQKLEESPALVDRLFKQLR